MKSWIALLVTGMTAFSLSVAHASEVNARFGSLSGLTLQAEWNTDCRRLDFWTQAAPKNIDPKSQALFSYFRTAKNTEYPGHLNTLAFDGTRQEASKSITNADAIRNAFRNLKKVECQGALAANQGLSFYLLRQTATLPLNGASVDHAFDLPYAVRCGKQDCKVSTQFDRADLVDRLLLVINERATAPAGASPQPLPGKAPGVDVQWKPYADSTQTVNGRWTVAPIGSVSPVVARDVKQIIAAIQAVNGSGHADTSQFDSLSRNLYVSLRRGLAQPAVKVDADILRNFAKRIKSIDVVGISQLNTDASRNLLFIQAVSVDGHTTVEAWPLACTASACKLVSAAENQEYELAELFLFTGVTR